MFCGSIKAEAEAYKLFTELRKDGTVECVDDFFYWVLNNKPEWVFNYVEEEKRYREDNEPKIREYFEKNFEGKTWNEIDPDNWSFYSDWHKDVFGYRPHGIVCGEYVNPHG